MRLPRARSSASHPHQLLTRRPPGGAVGRACAVGVLSAALATGCISVGGRLRLDDWSSYSDVTTAAGDAGGPRGIPFQVQVMDLQGNALPDVEVELDGPGEPQNCHTDARGRADRRLVPGKWHVRLSILGFHPVSRTVVIRSGEITTLTAYLRLTSIA